MSIETSHKAGANHNLRRLYVFNGGLLWNRRITRILKLAGLTPTIGRPSPDAHIGIWGNSPTAWRGTAMAQRSGASLVYLEDAFLRSVKTGRDGAPTLGLNIDYSAPHFDPSRPSDLERILAEHPFDNHALIERAKSCMAWIKDAELSKYNTFLPSDPVPDPGYVLIIDQTRDDAAVRASRADQNTFREMLYYAQEEHPKARIIIKTHPETQAGHRSGYFSQDDCTSTRITLCDGPVSPHQLFQGAIAVYTVSSQLGFEAILHGHKPVVFGQPFYMGWGLSDDRMPLDRRQRKLTRAQLFTGAMILYPKWYDPYHDRLSTLEETLATLEAQSRAWREDHKGWIAIGMKPWKRKPLQAIFGSEQPVRFHSELPPPPSRKNIMVWSSKLPEVLPKAPHKEHITRLEDGFLRSNGLGADLIPPLSLVCDSQGIYYDPQAPSQLEILIEHGASLRLDQRQRTATLIERLRAHRLSKYNLHNHTPSPDLSAAKSAIEAARADGKRIILVPGQVEDDASILTGTFDISTNHVLLTATRARSPVAFILYKPHPDVEAGLRQGHVQDAATIADLVLSQVDAITALNLADEVSTMTSLMGFEALLHNKAVTCYGAPFYAGWGLTQDMGPKIDRRTRQPDLIELVYACLVSYPRYFDPKTRQACPVEVVIQRLADDDIPRPSLKNRSLAKLQGLFASYAHLWR